MISIYGWNKFKTCNKCSKENSLLFYSLDLYMCHTCIKMLQLKWMHCKPSTACTGLHIFLKIVNGWLRTSLHQLIHVSMSKLSFCIFHILINWLKTITCQSVCECILQIFIAGIQWLAISCICDTMYWQFKNIPVLH